MTHLESVLCVILTHFVTHFDLVWMCSIVNFLNQWSHERAWGIEFEFSTTVNRSHIPHHIYDDLHEQLCLI